MSKHTDKSASRYILVTLTVLLFVTVMVMVIIQTSIVPRAPWSGGRTYKDGYAAGFAQARLLAYAVGLPKLKESNSFSGTVVKTGASNVTFKVSGLVLDADVDAVGLMRTAYVTKDTKIVLLQTVSSAEYAKRQLAYVELLRKRKPNEPLPYPPSAFTEKAGALRDIKPQNAVTVTSVNNQDILPLASFYASKISVTKMSE